MSSSQIAFVSNSQDNDPFYLRYYTGHSGKHGHEFLEFEYSHGRLRYANNSNYRNDSLIRKEMWISPLAVKEFKRIIEASEVTKEDDTNWPKKNIVGKQELEIRIGNDHIAFETAKIGSLVDIQDSEDPEGLRVFYYLIQDLRVVLCVLVDHPSFQDQTYLDSRLESFGEGIVQLGSEHRENSATLAASSIGILQTVKKMRVVYCPIVYYL